MKTSAPTATVALSTLVIVNDRRSSQVGRVYLKRAEMDFLLWML